mgnify:CR=1 FL=1
MIRAAGRRPPGLCSRRGACPAGCTPHFLFRLAEKKTGRARSKRKGRLGALRCSGPPRDGGRRIGASVDFAWPSGTLGPSARSILPSRGGWCPGRRGARTHLTSFFFRAFRFATRSPGGRGSLYRRADEGIRPYGRTMAFRVPVGADALIGPLHQLPCGTASGSENWRRMYPCTSPGQRFPQGRRVSVPDRRKGQPTFPRRRQEVCACADRPAEHFFFSTGRGAFSF